MDLNFSNILEGTRQYFQGLPKPQTHGDQIQDEKKSPDAPAPSPKDPRGTVQDERSTVNEPSPPAIAMADSRPPSESPVQTVPTPPVPFRPPSEPLLEPKPHIIHKATVMQQAQQKQQQKEQPFVNPSAVERPPSANMISPPSHIIHKPVPMPTEPKPSVIESSANRRTDTPEVQIMMSNSEPKSIEQSTLANTQTSVTSSKYSSHLPTPPQPSYTSSHLQSRTQVASQPRSLTVLQPRQSRASLPYPSTYPKDMPLSISGNSTQKPSQSTGHPSEVFVGNTHPQYETMNTQVVERPHSANLNYSNHKTIPQPPMQVAQKHNRVVHSNPSVHEAQYLHAQNHQKYMDEKSGMIRSYPQMVPQHHQTRVPERAPPTLKSQYEMAQRQHHQLYTQKVVTHSSSSSQYVQHPYPPKESSRHFQDPVISRSSTKLTEYSYPTRIAQHRPESIRHEPSATLAYQERIATINGDHRRSNSQPAAYPHQLPGRPSSNNPSVQYPRHGPVYSQGYPPKMSSEYPNPGARSQHPSNQPYAPGIPYTGAPYTPSENVAPLPSTAQPRGQLQNYQTSTTVRHSYESVKYGPSSSTSSISRNIPSKQTIAMHQQRETVSVTSLVNQMNVMRQQVPRSEPTGSVVKHKKESPLDLSVKTVRIPADSTAQDETENVAHDRREMIPNHNRMSSNLHGVPPTVPRHRNSAKPGNSSHKVDFLPNFSAPPVDKQSPQYRELNPYQYGPEKSSHYQQPAYHNAPAPSYPPKTDQTFSARYDIVPKSHTSYTFNSRGETSLPKIDLTLTIDEPEKDYQRNSQPTYYKEDLRKRPSSHVPITIPQKMPRYDSRMVDRHERNNIDPRDINLLNNSKLHNGSIPHPSYRKMNENHSYPKKSENIEPHLSKYYSHSQQQLHHPEMYGHRGAPQHHYDYHMSERLRATVNQESPVVYNVMNSTNINSSPADKRVLSILRNSLEAKNFSETAKISENSSDDCIIIPSDDNSTPPADFRDFQSKKAKHMIEHRQSLEAKRAENNRLSSSNEVSFKVSVPRAVDSIKYDMEFGESKVIRIREDLHRVPNNDTPAAAQPSNDRSSVSYDPDIAARIRTKAELKGFTLPTAENQKETVIVQDIPSVIKSTNSLGPSHKRVLFGKSSSFENVNEENNKNLNNQIVDGNVDISQKDKNKSSETENRVCIKSEVVEEDEDPFWSETCESFVEQLKTGKTKKGRKKKIQIHDNDLMEYDLIKEMDKPKENTTPKEALIPNNIYQSSDDERLSLKKEKKKLSQYPQFDYSESDDEKSLKSYENGRKRLKSQNNVEDFSSVKIKAEIIDESYEPEKTNKSNTSSLVAESSKFSESSDDEQLSVKREKKKLSKLKENNSTQKNPEEDLKSKKKNKLTSSTSKLNIEEFKSVKVKCEILDESYEMKTPKKQKPKPKSDESSDDEQLSVKKEKKKSLQSSDNDSSKNSSVIKTKRNGTNNEVKSLKSKAKSNENIEVKVKSEKLDEKVSKSNLTIPNVAGIQRQEKSKNKHNESSDEEHLSLKKKKKKFSKTLPNDTALTDSDIDETSTLNRLKVKKNSANNIDKKWSKTPVKDAAKIRDDISLNGRKPGFGDGSDFRPGWEVEVYNYKRSLRMPTRLINVTRPPCITRISSSLPDLDPYPHSPAPSSSTEEICSKKFTFGDKCKQDIDSDLESTSSFYINQKSYDSEASSSKVTTTKKLDDKTEGSSILDVLIKRYGKLEDRKKKLKEELSVGPKIIPKANNPLELLATPSLSLEKTICKKRGKIITKEKVMEDLFYRGSFRKETVSSYRDTFISDTNGLLGATEEFSPVVIKSRTRTETRVLKQRATIKEVFGAERPASAPPVGCTKEISEEKPIELKPPKLIPKKILKKHNIRIIRQGLRSERLLKRNDAKGRLMRIRKRNNYLKTIQVQKLKSNAHNIVKPKKEGSVTEESTPEKTPIPEVNIKIEKKSSEITEPTENTKSPEVVTTEAPKTNMKSLLLKAAPNKRFKKLFTRRKFSSGFDYIRKKKKLIKKELMPKVKKRILISRPSPESVHDIQREIKAWIIKKSVGETVLHRASRLGYMDCVAYCLEKLDMPPSCRDNAGYTPLHEACSRGHLDIARLLLQYGANVSEAAQGGIRPLHEACENDYVEIIRLLLSYGADPLLATYSGQTPISLSGNKAARFLQLHLNDVQGNVPQPWRFDGPFIISDSSGYDPLSNVPPPPTPPPSPPLDFVTATSPLPLLYKLRPSQSSSNSIPETNENNNTDTGLWCLLQELANLLQIKSRDALLKQVHCGPGPPRDSLRELKMQDFLDRAQCQQLLAAGEKINIRASKIALVKYTDKVKQLLNVETVILR